MARKELAVGEVGQAGGNVLVVEDHVDTVQVLVRILRRLGYRAEAAGTLAEARAKVAAGWRPDLMLVDLMLPDGSGLDLVRELRALWPVRAVAYSGKGMAADVARSREAGFAEHVTKPATVDVLAAALRRASAA